MVLSDRGKAALLVALLASCRAAAQTNDSAGNSTAGAARAAVDAFGERVGIDQVGLYSEYQTRGFDLMATSGAFRLDGFYFNPAAIPSESLIEGSSVNVGIAATALDLPSPTGVVAYRLREPGDADALQVTTGLRDYRAPHAELLGTLISEDKQWGVVGHALIIPDANQSTGGDGSYLSSALIGRWRPAPGSNVRLFASYALDRHDGDISVVAAGPGLPPALEDRRRYTPGWARTRSGGGNFGALAEHRWGRWSAGAGFIHSIGDTKRADVAVLEVDRAGHAASTLYYTPPVKTRSDSAEAKLARDFALLGAQHRIGLAIRQRRTVTGRAQATGYDAGHFTLDDGPAAIPAPVLPDDAIRGRDRVDQRIVSASYGLQIRDRFQLRLGAHSNLYEKKVDAFDGTRARRRERTWLYSASAIWQPATRFRLFASYVQGLEESGVAPIAASNRGDVLPPVEARQTELGARYEVAPGLNLIVAGFDIRKPIYGLRPDTLYAPVGTVRHRGIEASLTGRLTPTTTIVLGANALAPRVEGELVDAGLVRRVAPGVSRLNFTLSFEQQLTRAWSIDAYLLYEGPRRRDGISDTEVPAVPFAFAGGRYSWTWGENRLSLRGQLVNALGRRGYYATPYGPLVPVSPRTVRLLLSVGL
ncbi:MAG TPA: TonB-dependent receptor [Sphingomonas sp.]|uniref:TonB-dependent receptor domain-containing protein n=1 Tax=Sphingomonas sp. TaxID=28214 RepID=UPI002CD7150D|nr:TonB-dependent receptor [Sphingomonas sp.]HMI20832.1 TonB-dependent receptor [Sphingomonas sp.]